MTSKLVWNEDSDLYRFSYRIVERLQNAGFIAYFAGGCVRDALMETPPKDYDVATNARLSEIVDLFGEKNTLGIGAAFGVACVHGRIKGKKYQVEVATFRTDGAYSDGRHPDSVQFSTPQLDAQRRDFTINGMFFDPICGLLIDYVSGRVDIGRRVIQAIGVATDRIQEDKLRMLRAVRFAARFGFDIEAATAEAIRMNASKINVVSGERISGEMEKLLQSVRSGWGVQELKRLGLLDEIWPELSLRMQDESVSRIANDLLVALSHNGQFPSRLGALFAASTSLIHNASPSNDVSELERLKNQWKLSNDAVAQCSFSVRHYSEIIEADKLAWSQLQPLLIRSEYPAALQLANAIATVCNLSTSGIQRCQIASGMGRDRLDPPPLLVGEDLKNSGLKPGPSFAVLIKKARSLQLDGILNSKQEALEWLQREIRHP